MIKDLRVNYNLYWTFGRDVIPLRDDAGLSIGTVTHIYIGPIYVSYWKLPTLKEKFDDALRVADILHEENKKLREGAELVLAWYEFEEGPDILARAIKALRYATRKKSQMGLENQEEESYK